MLILYEFYLKYEGGIKFTPFRTEKTTFKQSKLIRVNNTANNNLPNVYEIFIGTDCFHLI